MRVIDAIDALAVNDVLSRPASRPILGK